MGFGMIAELIGPVLDKIFPDANERLKVRAKMAELADAGEFRELDKRMEAIVMEAKSKDPWTSRARPSFMYVMYALILAAIPFGIFAAFKPTVASAIAAGFKAWLTGIPTELYTLFGAGYLGYTVNRSNDKARVIGHEPKQGWLSRLFG